MDGMAPRDDKKKNGLGCGVCPVVVVVAEGFAEVGGGSSGWGSPCQDARESSFWRKDTYRLPNPSASPCVLASKVYTPI